MSQELYKADKGKQNSHGLSFSVNNNGRLPVLETFDTETFEENSYPLPQYLNSIEEIHPSGDSFVEETKEESLDDIYANNITTGLTTYINLAYPGLTTYTPLKIYADREHSRSSKGFLNYHCLNETLNSGIQRAKSNFKEKFGSENATISISNLIHIGPDSSYAFTEDIPYIPAENSILFVPMADLELSKNTLENQREVFKIAEILKEKGWTGWVLRSGEAERGGGLHYLADFILPYDNYWRHLGKLMHDLTIDNNQKIKDYANNLMSSINLQDSREIAERILNEYKRATYPDGYFDIRWAAHRLLDGFSTLRCIKAKGYKRDPYTILRIK